MTLTADEIIKEAELTVQKNNASFLEKKASEVASDMTRQRKQTELEKIAEYSPLIKLAIESDHDIFTAKSFQAHSSLEKIALGPGALTASEGFLSKLLAGEGAKRIAIGAGIGAGTGLLAGNKDDRMGSAIKGGILGAAGGAAYHHFGGFKAGPSTSGRTLTQFGNETHELPGLLKSKTRGLNMLPIETPEKNKVTRRFGAQIKRNQAERVVRADAAKAAGMGKHNALASLSEQGANELGLGTSADRLGVFNTHLGEVRSAGAWDWAKKSGGLAALRDEAKASSDHLRQFAANPKANLSATEQLSIQRGLHNVEHANDRTINPFTWIKRNKTKAENINRAMSDLRPHMDSAHILDAEKAVDSSKKAVESYVDAAPKLPKLEITGGRTETFNKPLPSIRSFKGSVKGGFTGKASSFKASKGSVSGGSVSAGVNPNSGTRVLGMPSTPATPIQVGSNAASLPLLPTNSTVPVPPNNPPAATFKPKRQPRNNSNNP